VDAANTVRGRRGILQVDAAEAVDAVFSQNPIEPDAADGGCFFLCGKFEFTLRNMMR